MFACNRKAGREEKLLVDAALRRGFCIKTLILSLSADLQQQPIPANQQHSSLKQRPSSQARLSLSTQQSFTMFHTTLLSATVISLANALPRLIVARDACSPQPTGSGPATTPDTADAFLQNPVYNNTASNAQVPQGYQLVFSDLMGSTSQDGYAGSCVPSTLQSAGDCD